MRTTPALALLASLLISSAAEAGTILFDLNGGGHYLTIGEAVQAAVRSDPGAYLSALSERVATAARSVDLKVDACF
jgi:hypothetical protein